MSTQTVPPLPRTPGGTNRFFKAYTQGPTTSKLERLFTRETPEAYRFFSRTIDYAEIKRLPWHQRFLAYARVSFLAFSEQRRLFDDLTILAMRRLPALPV